MQCRAKSKWVPGRCYLPFWHHDCQRAASKEEGIQILLKIETEARKLRLALEREEEVKRDGK